MGFTKDLWKTIALLPVVCCTASNSTFEQAFSGVNISSFSQDENAPAHAGCFIVRGGRLLTVKLTYDGQKYDIPGGQSTWHESARETAVRETWEESGYRVRAGRLLARVRNDFHIFHCYLLASEPEKGHDHEISEVNWFTMDKVQQLANDHEWRFQPAQTHLYTAWMQSSLINGANDIDEQHPPIGAMPQQVATGPNPSQEELAEQGSEAYSRTFNTSDVPSSQNLPRSNNSAVSETSNDKNSGFGPRQLTVIV